VLIVGINVKRTKTKMMMDVYSEQLTFRRRKTKWINDARCHRLLFYENG